MFFWKTKAHPLFKAIPHTSLNRIEHACNSGVVFYFSEFKFQKGMIYSSKYERLFLEGCHSKQYLEKARM